MDTPVRPPKEELGRHGLREGDTEQKRMKKKAEAKLDQFKDIWDRVREGLSRMDLPRQTISLQGMDATCVIHSVNNAITEKVNVSLPPQGEYPLLYIEGDEAYLNSFELAKSKNIGLPITPSGMSEMRTRQIGLPPDFIPQILNELRVVQKTSYPRDRDGRLFSDIPVLLMHIIETEFAPKRKHVGMILGFQGRRGGHAIAFRFEHGPSLESSALFLQDSNRGHPLEIRLTSDRLTLYNLLYSAWGHQTHYWGQDPESRASVVYILEDLLRETNVNPAVQTDMVNFEGDPVYPEGFGRELGRPQINPSSPMQPSHSLAFRAAEARRRAMQEERAARREVELGLDDADREVRAIFGAGSE